MTTLQIIMPHCILLENVIGIGRVMKKVLQRLRQLPNYHVLTPLRIDPKDLGEVISRPRYFFICIRQDCAKFDSKTILDKAARHLVDEVTRSLRGGAQGAKKPVLTDYLSPPTIKADGNVLTTGRIVNKACKSRTCRMLKTGKNPRNTWKEHHSAFKADNGLTHVQTKLLPEYISAKELSFSDREAEVFALWHAVQRKQQGDKRLPVVVDVSQSIHRARCRSDGSVPTMLTQSKMVCGQTGRETTRTERYGKACIARNSTPQGYLAS